MCDYSLQDVASRPAKTPKLIRSSSPGGSVSVGKTSVCSIRIESRIADPRPV